MNQTRIPVVEDRFDGPRQVPDPQLGRRLVDFGIPSPLLRFAFESLKNRSLNRQKQIVFFVLDEVGVNIVRHSGDVDGLDLAAVRGRGEVGRGPDGRERRIE